MVSQRLSRDELYANPWQPPEDRECRRRRRHAYFRTSLTARDWKRIAELADRVTDIYTPARLDDLDPKTIAVGCCRIGEEHRFNGERIGVIRGKAVLVWMK